MSKKKLTPRQRRSVVEQLALRDGNRCRVCGVSGEWEMLVPDRIDNSMGYLLENLQLLCKKHNTAKNPRGLGKFNPRRTTDDALPPRVTSAEHMKNLQAEPLFREWLLRMIRKHKRMYVKDVVNSGAEKAGCSQQTISRYLDKLTSLEGQYKFEADDDGKQMVMFRSTNPKVLEKLEEDTLNGREVAAQLLQQVS